MMASCDNRPPLACVDAVFCIFRPPLEADIPALHAICRPDSSLSETIELVNRAMHLTHQQRGAGLVGVVGDQPCAFGLLTRWPNVGEISDVMVREDLRGRGIGTQLIAELTQLAAQMQIQTLEIGAVASNSRALALYQRLGFVEHRRLTIQVYSQPETIIYLQKQR